MANESPLEVSDKYRVVGRNTAAVYPGSIHDDLRANDFGFEGGLVPGVNVLSHMCHPLLERWGQTWLEQGSLAVRLQKPAYHGQEIEITTRFNTESKPESCDVEAVCSNQICAVGTGLMQGSASTDNSSISDFEDVPMPAPENRPLVDVSKLFVGMPLGTIKNIYTRQDGYDFMEQMGEQHPPFTSGDFAHPGVLLSYAIFAFVWSFTTPVAIHAGCQMHFHKLLKAEMEYETRGRISEIYRKGTTDFVDYDYLVLSGRDVIVSGKMKAVVDMEMNESVG